MPKDNDEKLDVNEANSDANSQEHALTTRQKEILCLVAQGHTNREIGATIRY